MKKTISKFLILCFFVSVYTGNVKASNHFDKNKYYSLSAAAIDGETGRVLFEKDGHTIRPMASTTKIMTLILALEYGDLESYVTVSGYAAKMPEVRLGIKASEQYKLKDLLYAMMLESDNDCAVAVAEHISGSVEQFAVLMNKKATELGLSNTYFITPNGLDAEKNNRIHSTNAIELALLMKYCIGVSEKRDEFIRICQTKTYEFEDYSGKRCFTVSNKNRLLYDLDSLIAGKTGFTADAGYCYICAIEFEDSFVVISLLGSGWPPNKNYKWKDVLSLWTIIKDGYQRKEIIDSNQYHDSITVFNGYTDIQIPITIKDDVYLLLCEEDEVVSTTSYEKEKAPVREGDVVGTINLYVNGIRIKSINCYANKSVAKVTYETFFKRLFDRFFFH